MDLFFALPISAALGFKIFSNVAIRVKSLPTPGLEHRRSFSFKTALCRAVFRKIFWEGGGMNIHYRYRKIFKVNFCKVVYAVLTVSGINITMLIKFFFVTATAV